MRAPRRGLTSAPCPSVLQLSGGADVLLADTDVVWYRDPRPYVRAICARHPHLDMLVSSDHNVFGEEWRADVTYSSLATPDRRSLLAAYQIIRPGASTDTTATGSTGPPDLDLFPPDFDLDPGPFPGFTIGTWNPGMLLVRNTEGGRSLLAALMFDFERRGRSLVGMARKRLSSQSAMNKFLSSLLRVPCLRMLDKPPCRLAADAEFLFAVPVASLSALEASAAAAATAPRGTTRGRAVSTAGGAAGAATTLVAGLGQFPILQFGSFVATHILREHDLFGARPYATHATHVEGAGIVFVKNNNGNMGNCTSPHWCLGSRVVSAATIKAFTLRHYGLWLVPDPPSYYAGRFLTYTPQLPSSLHRFEAQSRFNASEPAAQWRGHRLLLQAQIQQFQSALALALALGRTLILPHVLGSCAYTMWPHWSANANPNCQPMHLQGLYPRRFEAFPSYWLNLPTLLRSGLPIRESSFFAHGRAAAAVRHSKLSIVPCLDEVVGVGARRSFCTTRGAVLMRARPGASEAAAALRHLREVRLLHVEDVTDAIGGFETEAGARAFGMRVSGLLRKWVNPVGRSSSGSILRWARFRPRAP